MRQENYAMRKHLVTLGWVWGVCFIAAWGAMGFVTVAERSVDVHGWSIAILALVVTIPIALLITLALAVFRASITGTAYERKLMRVRGLRIGFLSLLAGFAEDVAFGTGLGNIVLVLAIAGMVIGGIVHVYEMLRDIGA
jgi:hypothetical protein